MTKGVPSEHRMRHLQSYSYYEARDSGKGVSSILVANAAIRQTYFFGLGMKSSGKEPEW